MANPIPITIRLDLRKAYANEVTDPDFPYTEFIKFQELRPYSATITTDGATLADVDGWQFRFQVGTEYAYFSTVEVPSVVVINTDVDGFTNAASIVGFSGNANTDEFLDVITTPDISRFVTGKAELWGMAPGGAWELLAEWTVYLYSAIFDTTQTPSSSANSYYTKAQVQLMIAVDGGTLDTWAMKQGVPTANLTGTAPWIGPPQ